VGGRVWETASPSIEWRVIKITDSPLTNIDETETLPNGEIGELVVTGPVISERYVTRTDQNALHKLNDARTRLASYGGRWLSWTHKIVSGSAAVNRTESKPSLVRSSLNQLRVSLIPTPKSIALPWSEPALRRTKRHF
jgi:hypothetical protein